MKLRFAGLILLVVCAFTAGTLVAGPERIRPASELGYVRAVANEGYYAIVRDLGLSCSSTQLWAANNGEALQVGGIVFIPPECRAAATTTSTTTTVTPTTRPATTTTTVASTTTTTTTTVAPTTTLPATTTTTAPPAAGDWVQTFDGNQGGDTLRQGVYHRNVGQQEVGGPVVTNPGVDNNAWHGGSWTADHDMNCGTPATQRPLESEKIPGANGRPTFDFHTDELQYPCVDHWMTSVGDVDGYSIVWFSPDQVFDRATSRTISWDATVTDLGGRMWWEVSIVPAGGEHLATLDWMADVAHIAHYDPASIIVGTGPAGRDINITAGGQDRYTGWRNTCQLDPTGCASKTLRRPFSITDNGNGTITVNFAGLHTETFPGRLPERFEVYWKHHAYTPDKDGPIAGHTVHWDNLIVR